MELQQVQRSGEEGGFDPSLDKWGEIECRCLQHHKLGSREV